MAPKWLASVRVATIVLLFAALVLFPFLPTSGEKLPESHWGIRSSPGNVSSPALAWSNLHRRRFHGNAPASHLPNDSPIFFNPETYLSGGVYAFSVAVGDFNGDGNADLVVTNECPDSNCNGGAVSVLLGNGDGTFQAPQTYSSGGSEAYAVAVGDVNNDGIPDVIVANGCQSASQCANGAVGVLLGNGDGTFQAAQTYSSGGIVASSVTTADVNRDGNLDLIVANQCLDSTCASGGVSVLIGKGNGKFQAAKTYPSGGLTAVSVMVGYFTGTHKVDLVVANQCQSSENCNGNVGVLLGNGDGTFQAAQSYASGGYTAVSVAVGDFRGDGNTDLAVANQCQSSGNCSNGNLGVLLGNGDGTFQTAQNYASGGNNTASVAVSDLNGDGSADLVLANQCQAPGNCNVGSVSILIGNGDGTFQAAQNYISDGVFAQSAGLGDWNGDKKPDLAIVNQCQTNGNCLGTVTILLGNGDGTFQSPPSYASGGYDADAVAVGDLNGDGKPDLVVANLCQSTSCSQGNNGTVSVLLGNGDGTFQPAQKYATAGFGASSVAIGDFNGDGNADVVVANQCSTSDCESGGSVSILLGNGNGTLRPAKTYASGGYTSLAVAAADFNTDGNLDLAVANQCQNTSCENGSVSVLMGNGDGTFQSAQSFSSAGYETNFVAVGDFNGDGNADLVLTSQCQDSSCKNGGVSVLLGTGNGSFQTAQSYSSVGFFADSVAVTDLNGDGKADLVVSNLCESKSGCNNGIVSSLIGRGDGTFLGGHSYSSGGEDAYSVVTGDFNGDGYADVVVANSDGTCVLSGNGNGTLQSAVHYFPGGIFISSSDFNGDRKPDVVVAGGSLSNVTILLNVVAGYRWVTTTTLTSSPNPSDVNQSVLFTAAIANQIGGSPTGTVTFKSKTTTLGQGTVSNGKATLNYAFTSTGTDVVVASYSGDSTFLPSSSAPLRQNVFKAPSTTTLTSSPNPSQLGQTVAFTATVTGQYGGTPTGTVTFKDGATELAQVPLSDGVAHYKTSALTKRTHHIWGDYSGDANFRPSQGLVIQVVE
jgi:Big-like domain-containing protein/VCBS repeat protein/FG-GAP repeat protein